MGEVPVNVHMEAFNPCIPLDSKNSGLPVIIFNFTVTNSSSNAATVCLTIVLCEYMHAWLYVIYRWLCWDHCKTLVGWDGASDIINEGQYILFHVFY